MLDRVRAASKTRTKAITVEEVSFTIRTLDATETQAFFDLKSSTPTPSPLKVCTKLIGLGLANEDGTRALTDDQADAELTKLPYLTLSGLFEAVLEFNKLDKASQEARQKKSSTAR